MRVFWSVLIVFFIACYILGSKPGYPESSPIVPVVYDPALPPHASEIKRTRRPPSQTPGAEAVDDDSGDRTAIEETNIDDLDCGEPIMIDGVEGSYEVEPANC